MSTGDVPSVGERGVQARARLGEAGLHVAPMTPDRADALVAFHGRLSPDSTRRRYFTPHPVLTADEVHRFTNVDGVDRDAIVALDGPGNLVAVARLDRLGPGSTTAEVAFVVEDAWQHHGIGAAMFALLVERAAEMGIETLVAETLMDNRAMLAVFRHSGLPATFRVADGTVHVEMQLPAPTA